MAFAAAVPMLGQAAAAAARWVAPALATGAGALAIDGAIKNAGDLFGGEFSLNPSLWGGKAHKRQRSDGQVEITMPDGSTKVEAMNSQHARDLFPGGLGEYREIKADQKAQARADQQAADVKAMYGSNMDLKKFIAGLPLEQTRIQGNFQLANTKEVVGGNLTMNTENNDTTRRGQDQSHELGMTRIMTDKELEMERLKRADVVNDATIKQNERQQLMQWDQYARGVRNEAAAADYARQTSVFNRLAEVGSSVAGILTR
ncbi:MAG: hypothetical protein WBM08_14015 [Prochlorococcaceae cyanobacterium]